jgi:integrase
VPLRTIYRHAVEDDDSGIDENPMTALPLPRLPDREMRIATPAEAAELLRVLPDRDRALWATALYGGLRRGELLALQWENVDLAAGKLTVARSWDVKAGFVEPKSRAGRRTVPIVAPLRDFLDQHKIATGRDSGFVFGRTAERPFNHSSVLGRAATAWKHAKLDRAVELAEGDGLDLGELSPAERDRYLARAGFDGLGLHQCRHTFVSLMADAGIPLEQIGDYVGHSSTYMIDRYRHLVEGHGRDARPLRRVPRPRGHGGATRAGAAMTMTPKEYAFWPTPEDAEYGLLLCVDDGGKHWTLRGDPELVKMIRDAGPDVRAGLTMSGTWERREGWPDEWADD